MQYHYHFAGRLIQSDLPLPLCRASGREPLGHPRISISTSLAIPPLGGLIREEIDDRGRFAWRTYRSDEGQQWDVKGAGLFSISNDGTDVRAAISAGAEWLDFEHVLIGPILNQALQSNGVTLLHAGAIVADGRALAVTAESGYGKSTLIAHLAGRGYAALTDDILPVVHFGKEAASVERHIPRMKLWPDSLEAVGGCAERSEQVFSWVAKRQVQLADSFKFAPPGAFPLGAIYVLVPSRRNIRTQIDELCGSSAALLLLASMYMPSLILGERNRWALDAATSLANVVPTRIIRYTRSFDSLPQVADALLADFAKRTVQA